MDVLFNSRQTSLPAHSEEISSAGKIGLTLLLWFVILSESLGIQLGAYSFSIGMIVFLLFFVFWLFTGKLLLDKNRLKIYLPALVGILISAWVSSYYSIAYSLPSLLLLIGLYFPTLFVFKNKELQYFALVQFRKLMIIMAMIGIAQFIFQFLGIHTQNILGYLPAQLINPNYHYLIPVTFGSNLYKSNGIFFSEPSIFSQFLALAILLEIYHFRRYWRLALLLPALLLTFSGTGLVALAVGLIPLVLRFRWKTLLIFASIGVVSLSIFIASGYAYYTIKRAAEFVPGTSGYIRFIGPVVSYADFTQSAGSLPFWFGLGPGAASSGFDVGSGRETAYESTPTKLLFEYGFPAGLAFFAYLVFLFFFHRQLTWFSLTLFTMFTILSVTLLLPQFVVIYYVLLFLHKEKAPIRGI